MVTPLHGYSCQGYVWFISAYCCRKGTGRASAFKSTIKHFTLLKTSCVTDCIWLSLFAHIIEQRNQTTLTTTYSTIPTRVVWFFFFFFERSPISFFTDYFPFKSLLSVDRHCKITVSQKMLNGRNRIHYKTTMTTFWSRKLISTIFRKH